MAADVTFALVTQVTPDVEVRIAGDTIDVPVPLGNAALTLATGDRVALLRIGSQWTVAFVIAAL